MARIKDGSLHDLDLRSPKVQLDKLDHPQPPSFIEKLIKKVTGIYQFSILFFRNVFFNPSFFFHCCLSDKTSAWGKCGFPKEKQNICYMRDTLLFVLNNYVEKC